NCSGIQSFLFGVILQTAEIVVQYAFWQFLTPVSSSFVRNPGNTLGARLALVSREKISFFEQFYSGRTVDL
ncbi:MAG: hypothetical protein KME23_19750, partial [Goleter apudmare HA4340-LM2]|nr:hypothetical protein [Goleter apudmare HA4340-LM2]